MKNDAIILMNLNENIEENNINSANNIKLLDNYSKVEITNKLIVASLINIK